MRLITDAMQRGCLPSAMNDGADPAVMLQALLGAMKGMKQSVLLRASAVHPGRPTKRDRSVTAALDHRLIEKIMVALREAGNTGLSRTAIRDALGRNVPAGQIESALAELRVSGTAVCEMVRGKGRSREVWRATSLT